MESISCCSLVLYCQAAALCPPQPSGSCPPYPGQGQGKGSLLPQEDHPAPLVCGVGSAWEHDAGAGFASRDKDMLVGSH